jgi:glucosamine kinase
MILVADSGSSKTIWSAGLPNTSPVYFRTKGYNPLHISSEEIVSDLLRNIPNTIQVKHVEKVYFFGAGCLGDENNQIIISALNAVFLNANCKVSSDIDAAAIGLFGNKKGIACILGTGSNSVLWDGQHGVQFVKPLGYILGDEGSGCQMGMRFLKKLLRKQFSPEIQEFFQSNIELSYEQIMQRIYQSSETKSFLASFVPLMSSRISDPQIKEIAEQCFQDFIDTFIMTIPAHQMYPIGFCGSPAYWFRDILEEVMNKNGLSIENVILNPIHELTQYFIHDINAS